MGLESLFLFTLLGGLAAGAYVVETIYQRKREGARPWLVPLVVVVLFLVGMIAASTHVHNLGRAFGAVASGTINFGAGMTCEVAVSACFFVLALIDCIITAVRKNSSFALRVVTAIMGLLVMLLMGTAYIDVYGNLVWCDAPATVLTFLAGDLAGGLALYALLTSADYAKLRVPFVVINIAFALGLCLEIAVFSACGISPAAQVAGLVIAPVLSSVFAALSNRIGNQKALAILVFALAFVGIAIARFSFYATGALF